jgi:hypothetical protein
MKISTKKNNTVCSIKQIVSCEKGTPSTNQIKGSINVLTFFQFIQKFKPRTVQC